MNRLQERYVKEIRPELIKKHNYKSTMECPSFNAIIQKSITDHWDKDALSDYGTKTFYCSLHNVYIFVG